ncbi:MAG TPA: insulinase family protein [Vicinamibacterales bacterium]|nr:insulinase family protein [Vicinamibacterales bacterium]
MRLRRFTTSLLFVVLLGATGTWRASAQAPQPGRETTAASVAQYKLAEKMPLDPEAVVGKLPNGLTYYVRPNAKPAKRVELRLVVKAGSALEDDDQQGLAHFTEHMLFEGTKHFPGQGISDFLTSMGLSIGADGNAATSFDETEYSLGVPTDVPGVLDRALLVLEDWAGGALFEQSGIEHERGIVLSEWRLNLGAGERTEDKIRRTQLEGSRYADRPPIGKPDIIQNAKREQLLRFYHDWYRPDLMAVIVVGDVNRDATVGMIKSHFSSLVSPSPARPRPTFDVPEHPGTRYTIVSDQETTQTVVSLSNLRPARDQGSVGGYRAIMLDQLFGAMLTDRFDELSHSATPPFLQAQADRSLFPMPRTKDDAVAQALVASDGVLRGLETIETELQRVTRFGFTGTELDRAKNAMMRSYERVAAESPDRESSSRADEYTRNFLEDEALPTIWQELAFHRRFLPDVTLAELNALATDWFPERNRLVIVSAPQSASVQLPTQAQLEGVVAAVAAKPLEGYVDAGAGRALMDTTPAAGTVVKTAEPASGITEWTLSNGARVVMKPTTLKEDQILFRAFAPGGTSLASDDDFIPARSADDVIGASGIGGFSEVELGKALSGKAVAVQPYIGELEEGLNGGSTPQDLETLFQLIYLRFTAPRSDATAFAAMQAQARALVANQNASPDVVFNQAISDAMSQRSPRRAPETTATVDRWNLAKSLAFYKARFADASNFTFVFVGSFNVDTLKPLAEKYLASLPATNARETWRDLNIRPPAGKVETTVQKGIAPKSAVALVFSGPFQYDDDHILALRTMTLILQSRLLDTIRQELGGTYSITVNPTYQKIPSPMYAIRIEWTCDPARTEALVQRVFDEIAFVRTTSLRQEGMASLRQTVKRELDDQQQNNGYWLGQIARRYSDGGGADLASLDRASDRIAALSTDAIHRAAIDYLDMSRFVRVTLMPESK